MDKGQIQKLNAYHVIFLVQGTIMGVKLLTLPHDMSAAGYDQWWIPLLMGLIAQMTLLPMIWLCRRYPDDTLFVMNEKLLGKWLGKMVNVVMTLFVMTNLATVAEGYIRLVQATTLANQTITLPLIGLFLVMIYITLGGIKAIARFNILAFFFTGWMIYYLQWGYQKGQLSHIFPLFNITLSEMAEAVNNSYAAMLGYEMIMFYFPYIIKREKALLHASIGLWITVGFYVLVSITSVAYFSEWQLSNTVYPVLNLFKAVELSFLERVENLGVGLWVFLILGTLTTYLWVAKKGLDSVLGKKRAIHLYLPVIGAFFLIRGPFSSHTQKMFHDIFTLHAGYGVVLWPNVLLLIHLIRKPWRGRDEKVDSGDRVSGSDPHRMRAEN
jgi:spore germination protein AB